MVNFEEVFKNGIEVINTLKNNGYEAYFVGGCVRDYILKTKFNDIDITTSARPKEIQRLFPKTLETGIKYGTITIVCNNENIEVTTYRVDSVSTDQRHPDSVEFENNAKKDVLRRDFTINGILMDENFAIFDFCGGQKDLSNKLIRTIGEPSERFNEDLLRMLRAFYFQSKLGFQIEKKTREAIYNLRDKVSKVSKERVLTELIKIIKHPNFNLACKSMVLTQIHNCLPGLAKGIEFFSNNNIKPTVDVFFIASFYLNGESVLDFYNFSNLHKNLYYQTYDVIKARSYLEVTSLFKYGLLICKLANTISNMLGYDIRRSDEIEKKYNKLPIKSEMDINISGDQIIKFAGKKPGAWVSKTINLIVNK
ncbi:MAG: CCA tRNA nucleotidyltransferase, partial [Acholeplasmatales bacterium]|nr:CCA tRNA nucleotidyltransferase [Acholeplasmatales bacterium]